jgi:hypothetical protein
MVMTVVVMMVMMLLLDGGDFGLQMVDPSTHTVNTPVSTGHHGVGRVLEVGMDDGGLWDIPLLRRVGHGDSREKDR